MAWYRFLEKDGRKELDNACNPDDAEEKRKKYLEEVGEEGLVVTIDGNEIENHHKLN